MNEEQLKLLLKILGIQGGATSPMFDAGAMLNVSPSSITSALNPEVLLASGLLDTGTLGAGIAGTEQQLLQEFLAKSSNNVPVPLETTPMWFRDVTGNYGVQAVKDPTLGRMVFIPTANDDLSEYMADQFNAISSGEIVASQAKTALADLVSMNDTYKPFASQLSSIQNALDIFEKKSEASNNAALKYEYDVSQSAGSAVAPTRQQALNEYYKSIGVPQLALLGDPTMGYEIPSQVFERGQRVSDLEKELAKQRSAMKRGESRYGEQAAYEAKQAEVYAQKAIADEARRRAEEATSGMKSSLGWTEDPVSKVLNLASRDRFIGGLFGEDSEAKMKAEKEAAYKRFYDAAVRELSKKPVKSVAIQDLSPEYGLAKAKAYTAEKALQSEKDRAARVAELVSQGLASRGQTPFNAQLQQLLGYAVTAKRNK